MEVPQSAFVTMEELVEEAAVTEEQDKVLDRLKLAAEEWLPTGWRNWKVVNLSKEEIFGDELDPQVLNKLRFALPTVAIARAFNPSTQDLPEKQYRDFKVEMLNWAFCRALIMSPPAVVNKIKGSASQAEIFLHALKPLKDQFISRKQAADLLRPEEETSEEEQNENEPLDGAAGKRRIPMPNNPAKRSRIAQLEERMENMFHVLLDKIENKNAENEWSVGSSEESDGESLSDGDPTIDQIADATAWKAPELMPTQEKQPVSLEALALVPQVKESAPAVPPPAPEIKAQGLECQKLGTASWNRIRYKDVQKKLQASPVFDALKVNSQLESLAPKSFANSMLERAEEMAGTITHGLLKQRQKLSEGMQRIAQKYPEAFDEIKNNFLGDSAFKEISDDLLHYTCARRAELIELRRKSYKPKDHHLAAKLAEIPPSESHLFDEEALSKFFDQRGGFHRVFYQRPQSFAPKAAKGGNFRSSKPQPSRGPSNSAQPREQKSSSHKSSSSANSSSFRKPSTRDFRKSSARTGSAGKDRPRRL
ncbi:uncharacterized protein LOC123267486 [Cotesia glomerata]|uniref:uncharacterized protein LOC123262357 n=1 Tax=Cotesia glomerata TaxID=32391 RepID=UPI001D01B473|nr:uncharacterized protein LOC123262357 [Cotesia glomerata]XP_044588075.1 uncharacterized protein LOC123267486 [Cotesia glomerata]